MPGLFYAGAVREHLPHSFCAGVVRFLTRALGGTENTQNCMLGKPEMLSESSAQISRALSGAAWKGLLNPGISHTQNYTEVYKSRSLKSGILSEFTDSMFRETLEDSALW